MNPEEGHSQESFNRKLHRKVVGVRASQWILTPDPGCALPELGPTRRDIVLRVGKEDTHTKRPGSSTRVNGNFIKLKSDIYTSGLERPKMQSLLPTRSSRED